MTFYSTLVANEVKKCQMNLFGGRRQFEGGGQFLPYPLLNACFFALFAIHKIALLCKVQVSYRKDSHMQNSMRKLKLTLTLVLTLTDTGGAVLTLMLGYRSVYIASQ